MHLWYFGRIFASGKNRAFRSNLLRFACKFRFNRLRVCGSLRLLPPASGTPTGAGFGNRQPATRAAVVCGRASRGLIASRGLRKRRRGVAASTAALLPPAKAPILRQRRKAARAQKNKNLTDFYCLPNLNSQIISTEYLLQKL
ncbi:MAG: hypothetical protein Pg6A_09760 [Termitinemataceae bacterium]|nr:MAG: hypothetical protein Pg6A_09760 [Termitinemataceae bacterium]